MSGVRARMSASVPSNSVRTAARTTLGVGAAGFVDDGVAVRIDDDDTDLDTVRGVDLLVELPGKLAVVVAHVIYGVREHRRIRIAGIQLEFVDERVTVRLEVSGDARVAAAALGRFKSGLAFGGVQERLYAGVLLAIAGTRVVVGAVA